MHMLILQSAIYYSVSNAIFRFFWTAMKKSPIKRLYNQSPHTVSAKSGSLHSILLVPAPAGESHFAVSYN